MNARSNSDLLLVLDQMRGDRNEANLHIAAIRLDIKQLCDKLELAIDAAAEMARSANDNASKAHQRLDARESREKGIMIGIGLGSGSIGAALMKFFS
ncbi:outer membrane murein-binding lipoprotein Lpp [Agrobacterium tumefaciens]|uniref:Outer membrane murein-binding lipoprotein Lpp n=1 Tax=Agrobacterium tumefaciens TaxID=358 RepID=A0AAW8LSA0_AGRTU|nr:hypothetical protein [Agrobacterium tumefaciens]MBP2564533.1 outer membrane murein-binding lipoprotein Lpp [Agrobacterium tumefaciens]MDR6701602.1 outer membrane murein-binding lipoprotein Lpp [Agrobacterium tumefaciens]